MTAYFKRFLTWYDQYGLLIVAGFLLAFIPLYPKIPLFSPIEEYVVRVRLEDLAVAIGLLLTLIQVVRRKAKFHKTMFVLMGIYALIAVASMLSSIFLIEMIPLQFKHIAKTLLHFFRYLEYFSVFFITYAAVKRKRDVYWLIGVTAATVLAIAVYGYMQKFFYWPVYSTMNREFSKGIRLVLTEFARIQSTFAGHYDMAAYLVITLAVLLSVALAAIRKRTKWLLLIIFALGFWLMVMSASRIPFAASLLGIAVVILGQAWVKPSLRTKALAFVQYSATFALFLVFMLYYFGQDMLNRMSNLISTGDNPIVISDVIDDFLAPLPIPQSDQLIAWLPKSAKPPVAAEPAPDLEEAIAAQVATINDQMPVPKPTGIVVQPAKPRDVFVDIPEPIVQETVQEDGSTKLTVINRPRVYSDCALKHELSLCIRLESLWPWALQSFYTNPLLGTGYATLNKQYVEEFTFVDGTDNNYLRTLGETGILGFLSFYGIVGYAVVTTASNLRRAQHGFYQAVLLGYVAGTLGLLINAVYIDVFAASKVAYAFWMMTGIVLAAPTVFSQIAPTAKRSKTKPAKRKSKS